MDWACLIPGGVNQYPAAGGRTFPPPSPRPAPREAPGERSGGERGWAGGAGAGGGAETLSGAARCLRPPQPLAGGEAAREEKAVGLGQEAPVERRECGIRLRCPPAPHKALMRHLRRRLCCRGGGRRSV